MSTATEAAQRQSAALRSAYAALKDARAIIEDATAERYDEIGIPHLLIAGIEVTEWDITLERVVNAIADLEATA